MIDRTLPLRSQTWLWALVIESCEEIHSHDAFGCYIFNWSGLFQGNINSWAVLYSICYKWFSKCQILEKS
jgi:hypothetical protein